MSDFIIGVVLIGIGVGLFIAGLPRGGVNPRFLQFEAAVVLYPPLILVFLILGAAEVATALY